MIASKISGLFKGKSVNGVPVKTLRKYHIFSEEITAYGYTSPVALPSSRIKDLIGEVPLGDVASLTHLSANELNIILNNPAIEPTSMQFFKLMNAYQVPLLWLMGYHVSADLSKSNFAQQQGILSLMARRNSMEQYTQKRSQNRGLVRKWITASTTKKIMDMTREIRAKASLIVQKENLPLDAEIIARLKGFPVYITFLDNREEGSDIELPADCWGISAGDSIQIPGTTLPISNLNTQYQAYMTHTSWCD